MFLAWKEIVKNKLRFSILGSIVFLVSFLTFIISGLADGLSQDNASLIKDLPEGIFYINENAEQNHNLSKIDDAIVNDLLTIEAEAVALSIQYGFLNDKEDKQRSVTYVTSTQSPLFEQAKDGEVILDKSIADDGVEIGDVLADNQYSGEFVVKQFVEQKKFGHIPVAYISPAAYKEIYRVDEMQLVFVPHGEPLNTYENLETMTKDQLLNTILGYNAEQTSLTMIVIFLIVISGMLFAIFFYMMNVQKINLFGILKAIGVKTSTLFQMMWTQMIFITVISLLLSIGCAQLFNIFVPAGMPFHLPLTTIIKMSVLFIIVGFIGSTLSGIQIKRVEPLDAIQQGE